MHTKPLNQTAKAFKSIDSKRLLSPSTSPRNPLLSHIDPTWVVEKSSTSPRFQLCPPLVSFRKNFVLCPSRSDFQGQMLKKRNSAYSSLHSVQVLFSNSSQEVESNFERIFSTRINPCPRLMNPIAFRVHNELTT